MIGGLTTKEIEDITVYVSNSLVDRTFVLDSSRKLTDDRSLISTGALFISFKKINDTKYEVNSLFAETYVSQLVSMVRDRLVSKLPIHLNDTHLKIHLMKIISQGTIGNVTNQ